MGKSTTASELRRQRERRDLDDGGKLLVIDEQ